MLYELTAHVFPNNLLAGGRSRHKAVFRPSPLIPGSNITVLRELFRFAADLSTTRYLHSASTGF